jgi:hypothetical protein
MMTAKKLTRSPLDSSRSSISGRKVSMRNVCKPIFHQVVPRYRHHNQLGELKALFEQEGIEHEQFGQGRSKPLTRLFEDLLDGTCIMALNPGPDRSDTESQREPRLVRVCHQVQVIARRRMRTAKGSTVAVVVETMRQMGLDGRYSLLIAYSLYYTNARWAWTEGTVY